MADQNPIPSNLPIVEDKKFSEPIKPFVPPSVQWPSPVSSPAVPKVPPPTVPEPSRSTRSFIRTMQGDIQAVQAGKTPQGVEKQLPANRFPSFNQPAPSGTAVVPIPSLGAQVSLGKMEQKMISVPTKEEGGVGRSAPKPAPNISLPSPKPSMVIVPPVPSVSKPAPAFVLPSVPKPASSMKPEEVKAPQSTLLSPPPLVPLRSGPSLNVSEGGSSWLSSRNVVAVVVILAVGGLAYWFFGMYKPGKVAITPTVTPRNTPKATFRELKLGTFFQSSYSLSIARGEGKNLTSVVPEILKLNIPDQSKHILLNPRDEYGADYSFSGFLERFLIDFPTNLSSYVDENDFDLILTKQEEEFDSAGKPIQSFGDSRVALVVRVTNAEQARSILLDWENTLGVSLQELFVLPKETKPSPSFFSGNYRDVAIRYLNFVYPDRSVDYAVITATNNDDYLVISSSREQMFGIIDALLGFAAVGR